MNKRTKRHANDKAINTRTRVVVYVRASTGDQELTLDIQRARCEAYAIAIDVDIVEVIVDAGESGKDIERPGLIKALAMLRAGKADGVLIAKLDRLTRSVADLGGLLSDYFGERGGYQLLSVGDSIDTRTATGRLVLNVLASVAQWERETIGERTSAALQEKISRGECAGNAPFGFRSVPQGEDKPSVLVRDDSEWATIRAVCRAKASGASYTHLVDMAFVGRGGKPLARNTLHNIVQRYAADVAAEGGPELRAAA